MPLLNVTEIPTHTSGDRNYFHVDDKLYHFMINLRLDKTQRFLEAFQRLWLPLFLQIQLKVGMSRTIVIYVHENVLYSAP